MRRHLPLNQVLWGGGGAGGKHLSLPVPLLQPPVPFCELFFKHTYDTGSWPRTLIKLE